MCKKFLLIGHSVLDTIVSGSKKTIRPGGIFYSTLAMLNLKEEKDTITLFTNYDESSYKYFKQIYIQTDFSKSTKVELIPRVELKINKDKERTEKFSHLNQKICLPDNFSQYDFVLVNMITGYEMSPNDLTKIKSETKAIIYFDVHSLSRGMGENNIRYSRRIPNAAEWLKSIDILQANEFEILTLSDSKNEDEIAAEILDTNVKILLITKGNNGSTAYFSERNKIQKISLSAIKINSVNSVGCGDVFGAAFLIEFSKTNSIIESLSFANKAGGIITSYSKISDYEKLKKDITNYHE